MKYTKVQRIILHGQTRKIFKGVIMIATVTTIKNHNYSYLIDQFWACWWWENRWNALTRKKKIGHVLNGNKSNDHKAGYSFAMPDQKVQELSESIGWPKMMVLFVSTIASWLQLAMQKFSHRRDKILLCSDLVLYILQSKTCYLPQNKNF